MSENVSTSPAGARAAAAKRTHLVLTLTGLVLLAIAQVMMYEEEGWNVGVILAAVVLLGNLAWQLRRQA
jgi:hypothetical protein